MLNVCAFAGVCGEDKQRFNLCVCKRGPRKACFDNIPRCWSQLYASVIVLILMVDTNFYIFLEVVLVGSSISIPNVLTLNEALIDRETVLNPHILKLFLMGLCVSLQDLSFQCQGSVACFLGFYWFLLLFNPNLLEMIMFSSFWVFTVCWFYTDMSCFQGLFFCPDAASLLLHNFCVYHIDAPGHEVSISHAFI